MQLLLRISFNGDMSFNISTELTLNFPTPQFMSIPVTLGLRHLSLHGAHSERGEFCVLSTPAPAPGMCILAVVNKRIHICFDNDETMGGYVHSLSVAPGGLPHAPRVGHNWTCCSNHR